MPRLTRQEKQAETRRQLVDAATRVFARRGYMAASVEEIADEAGFSHGAVYSNFSGKEDLFLAVHRERIAHRQAEIAAAGPPRAAADDWMQKVRDDPEYFLLFLEFVLHTARNPEVAGTFAEQTKATRTTIARLLDDAPDAERLALIIRALGLGLAIEHVLDPDAVPHEVYGDAVELLLRATQAEPPTDPSGPAGRGRSASRSRRSSRRER